MLFFKVVSFQDNFSAKIMKICKLKCLKMNQESIFFIIIPEISFNFHDDRFPWYLCRFFQNYEISQKSWKISESWFSLRLHSNKSSCVQQARNNQFLLITTFPTIFAKAFLLHFSPKIEISLKCYFSKLSLFKTIFHQKSWKYAN